MALIIWTAITLGFFFFGGSGSFFYSSICAVMMWKCFIFLIRGFFESKWISLAKKVYSSRSALYFFGAIVMVLVIAMRLIIEQGLNTVDPISDYFATFTLFLLVFGIFSELFNISRDKN